MKSKKQGFFRNSFFTKNKGGFLLAEETLKIVVAVICIGFLVFFLTSLYFAKMNSEKLKQAESSLERISEVIENAEANSELIGGLTPEGWYLFSFVDEKKPNSCAGKNCLCICDKLGSLNFWSSQVEKCNKDGVCLIVDNLENKLIEIEIKKDLTSVLIKKEGNIKIEEIK